MLKELKNSIISIVLLTVLCGAIYPLVVTGIAQLCLKGRADGSMLPDNGGSALIGQPFDDPKYFWGRLSDTSPTPYNAAASGGSNFSPTNPALVDAAAARIAALKVADPTNTAPIPVDLATASASGLDPHISIATAEYQAARIAHARGIDVGIVKSLIARATEPPLFGFLGDSRVNVLLLNLALDGRGPLKSDKISTSGPTTHNGWRGNGFMPE